MSDADQSSNQLEPPPAQSPPGTTIAKSDPAGSYSNSIGSIGTFLGIAASFSFPSDGSILLKGIAGGVLGGGGAALGTAVGQFLDYLREKPTLTEQMPARGGMALTSLVFGVMGLIAWVLPLAGLPVTIVGFLAGKQAVRSPERTLGLIGMGLSLLGLLLSSGNGLVGGWMAASAAIASHPH
jgi:hypothetical protein